MNTPLKFIIVDDDNTNNNICRILIRKALNDIAVDTYTDPQAALDIIKEQYSAEVFGNCILFLDVNMPTMSGWDFLDLYNHFNETVKQHIHLYVVSSSLYQYDHDRACANNNVRGYLVKPLSIATIKQVYNDAATGNLA